MTDEEQEELAKIQHEAAELSIKQNRRFAYSETKQEVAAAAVTTLTINVPYKEDRIYTITNISAADETSASKQIDLYFQAGGQKHLIKTGSTGTNKDSVGQQCEIITGENTAFLAVYTTPTASDKLRFSIIGHYVQR